MKKTSLLEARVQKYIQTKIFMEDHGLRLEKSFMRIGKSSSHHEKMDKTGEKFNPFAFHLP